MPDYGSLTKEFPLASVEQTISAIDPGMHYRDLLQYARANGVKDIPGLARKRFISVDHSGRVVYDEFLALVQREGLGTAITRKVMLFTWLYRDDRVQRFVIERVADASGHWNPMKLLNKNNGDFFEQWYRTGAKPRSNFENFVAEIGILDRTNQSIHFGLDDGWLEDGARVVAQYEPNPELRRHILENPYKYLADRNWNALVNATPQELMERAPSANFVGAPIEDNLILTDPVTPSASRVWNRKRPGSFDKTSTEALLNLVACERANQSHFEIEKALADKIKALDCEPKSNDHIDMFFMTIGGSVVAEVKSCNQGNIHSQIRRGVSQLLEYRYVYRDDLIEPIHLLLVLEVEPRSDKRWLIDYLQSIGITVAWGDTKSSQFSTVGPVSKILNGIVMICSE
jgi:hypothetical protein